MRTYLRRYLPDPDKLRQLRGFRLLGETLFQPALWHLNRRTAQRAAAIGMFCGLIPGPLQMLGSAALCLAWRANLPLALVATLYTNPFTIVPLYLAAYRIGTWISGENGGFVLPPDFEFAHPWQSVQAWLDWVLSLGYPLAWGLPILAISLAVVAYFSLGLAWKFHSKRAWQHRRSSRAAHLSTVK